MLTSGKPADLPPFRTSPDIFILLPKISGLRSLWEKPSAAQPSRAGSGIIHRWDKWQGLRDCAARAPMSTGGVSGAVLAPHPAGTRGRAGCQEHGCASRHCERWKPQFVPSTSFPDSFPQARSLFLSPSQLLLSFVHIITNLVPQEFPEREMEKKGRQRKHKQ